jgi:hypothetical protein
MVSQKANPNRASPEPYRLLEFKKSEIRISGKASVSDQYETEMLNPKLETLNSKQTQMSKTQKLKTI